MLRTWNCIVGNDPRLLKMMSDSLSIYDQALYYQRQSYFETKEQGKIKTYSYVKLWDIMKKHDKVKSSQLDINVKQYIVKQVCTNWVSFIKATIAYRRNPEKFTGRPNMPKYLYKSKDYNLIYIDKTRFRNVDVDKNCFRLPCSDYTVRIPKQIDIRTIRQIAIQKYYNKIKINIIFEDLKEIKNKPDMGSVIGIDLGVNNLCAITSNNKSFSYIINGRPLKSINQFYNKILAETKSKLETFNKKKNSKALRNLTLKRNNKINYYIHCASRMIIELCLKNNIEKIIIGHNKGWKNNVDMRATNNQNFVQIPFNILINQLLYKSEKYDNLQVIVVEESYTSKVDHLALESMEKHDVYLGKRVNRGLFKSSNNKLLNADVNGAIGILRKGNAISEAQLMDLRNRGDVVAPKMLTQLTLKGN